MDELIKCRVTLWPDRVLKVDQAEHDQFRRMGILIPDPEIDQQAQRPAAAAKPKRKGA